MSGKQLTSDPKEPMVTTAWELAWMKRHLPEHHRMMLKAIREGAAVVNTAGVR